MKEKGYLNDGPKAKYLLGKEIIQINTSIDILCQSSHDQLGEIMALTLDSGIQLKPSLEPVSSLFVLVR